MIGPSPLLLNFRLLRVSPYSVDKKTESHNAYTLMQHQCRQPQKGQQHRVSGNQRSNSRACVRLRRGFFGTWATATVTKAVRTHGNCSLICECHPQVSRL